MAVTSLLDPTASVTFHCVNPAFLQEIKDSNPDYWESLNHLRQCCHSQLDSTALCLALCKRLDHLRDILALQFSLEESYGYITIGQPAQHRLHEVQLCEQTAETLAQHSTLYLKLSDLAEQAEELQYRGMELTTLRHLVAKVSAFVAQLQDHEHRESQLIERTMRQLKQASATTPL